MAVNAAAPTGELTEPEADAADPEVAPAESGADEADTPSEPSATGEDGGDSAGATKRRGARLSPVRLGLITGLAMVLALGGLAGWLGFRDYQLQQAQQQRAQFVQTARQGALNLTTIDWEHADGDIQRILAGATGGFYDDFSSRAQPFVDVVKQVKSKSEGTVTEAAVESVDGDQADVLVSVGVKTTTPNTPEPQTHAWRMRMTVQKSGEQMKVSNVQFVA